jgi:SH3 domain-containing protein
MDLEAVSKSLSKRNALSTKKIAFVAVAGLVLVGGIGLRASHYFGGTPPDSEPAAIEAPAAAPAATPSPVPAPVAAPEAAPPSAAETAGSVPKTAPATQEAAPAPSEPAGQTGGTAEQTMPEGDAVGQAAPEGDAVGQSEQADLPGAGMILVARKPVQVLAGPSASAPAMYGFPAGRPFRVIGRQGGFVQIKDLRSSASGWIDEAALAAPPSAPSVAAPSQSKPGAVNRKPATASADPKPQAVKKNAPVAANPEPAAEPDPARARRPTVLFGRGGFFGGIFGGGNAN